MEIVEGPIGSQGKYDLEFKAGKLQVVVSYGAGALDAGIQLGLDAGAILDALEKVIPGDFEVVPFAALKEYLKKL